ncbi:MAG: amidoligase family protein [Conexivisphaerales archaeon]
MNEILEQDIRLLHFFKDISDSVGSYFSYARDLRAGLFGGSYNEDVITSPDRIIHYIQQNRLFEKFREEMLIDGTAEEGVLLRDFLDSDNPQELFRTAGRYVNYMNMEDYVRRFRNFTNATRATTVISSWNIYKKLLIFAGLATYLLRYSNADMIDNNKILTVESVASLLSPTGQPSLNRYINYDLIDVIEPDERLFIVAMKNPLTGRKIQRSLRIARWDTANPHILHRNEIGYSYELVKPSFINTNEKEALKYYTALYLAQHHMVPTMQRWKNMVKQVLLIMDVVKNLDLLETIDSSSEIVQPKNFHYNPTIYLNSYSHRTVSVPIMADLLGIELEYDGDVEKISNFGKEFEYLRENGWVLERDSSVTLELKSPIITLDEINSVSKKCKNLFNAWAENTNSDSSGLHVHVSMDKEFIIGKQPVSKTSIFLTRLVQEIESNLFQTVEQRKKVFKRDFNSFARSSLEQERLDSNRDYWINLEPLYRNYGKTIEVRLGSAALANEINVYAEKAYMIVKLIKFALKNWRANNRQDYTEWRASLNGKLLKALLPKDDLKRFIELFG